MTINAADALYMGDVPVDAVYLGDTQVYSAGPAVSYIERFNLMRQPSLEIPMSADWNERSTAATSGIELSTDMAYSGTTSLKLYGIRSTATTIWQHYGKTKAGMPAIPGHIYRLSYHVRCNTVVRNSFMGVFWYNAAGAQLGFVTKVIQINGPIGVWNEVVGNTAAAPADTVYMAIRVNVAGVILDEAHYFDGLAVEDVTDETPVRVYFDGDSTGSDNVHYAWMGTPHDSVSRERIDQAAEVTYRKNLVYNPSFENNTGWWFSGADTTISIVSAPAGFSGISCLKHVALNNDLNTWTGIGMQPVLPETEYTFSIYVRAESVARSISLNFDGWVDMDYTKWTGGFAVEKSGETVGAWTRLSWTFTSPAETVYADIYLGWVGTLTGEIHYIDAAMLETVSAPGPYFDGSTAATGSSAYSWDGAAHASPSTEATLS